MHDSTTAVEIGDSSFDVAAIGDWAISNFEYVLIAAFIVFMFWIFQKGGFAEKYLEYRVKSKELDAKQVDDMRELTDMFRQRHGVDEPLLPFDDVKESEE